MKPTASKPFAVMDIIRANVSAAAAKLPPKEAARLSHNLYDGEPREGAAYIRDVLIPLMPEEVQAKLKAAGAEEVFNSASDWLYLAHAM